MYARSLVPAAYRGNLAGDARLLRVFLLVAGAVWMFTAALLVLSANLFASQAVAAIWSLLIAGMLLVLLALVALWQREQAKQLWQVLGAGGGWVLRGIEQPSVKRLFLRAAKNSRRCAAVIVFLLLVAGVSAQVAWQLNQRASMNLSNHFQGTVHTVGYPKSKQSELGSSNWVVATTSTNSAVRLHVWLPDPPAAVWPTGTALEVSGKLQPQNALSAQAAALSARDVSSGATAESVQKHLFTVFAKLRSELLEYVKTRPGLDFLPGFTFGDTGLITESVADQMRVAGLTHLLAVSGGNCALVVAATGWLLSQIGCGRKLRLAAALAALSGFALLVGPDASLLRAAVMATVLLVSKFGVNRTGGVQTLCLAVIVLLFTDPWQAVALGFVLSVAATAAILLLSPLIVERLHRILPKFVALPLSVTLAAQLGVSPLLVLLTPEISFASLPANLLAAPVAPLVTGLGLFITLLLPVVPVLAHLLLPVAQILCETIRLIAVGCASLPFAAVAWLPGVPGLLALAVCEILLICLLLRAQRRQRELRRNPWRERKYSRRQFVASGMLVVATVGVFVFGAVGAQTLFGNSIPKNWSFAACDVGQGDALVLRDPAHPQAVMLMDTGEKPQLLARCLRMLGVEQLALVALSHDDRDHVGAFSQVATKTRQVLVAPQPDGSKRKLFKQFTDEHSVAVATRGDILRVEKTGTAVLHKGSVPSSADMQKTAIACAVLWPEAQAVHIGTNQASLVLNCTVGGTRVLLLGDTGAQQHRRLLALSPQQLTADIVKVAHHGSKDQDPQLARATRGKYAVFSAGRGNDYGHPHPDALRAYKTAGAELLRTDKHGIIVYSDAEVWVEKSSNQ